MAIAPAPRRTQRYPKLTESEVSAIIAALEEGATAGHLAAVYNVTGRMIRAIKHRLAWDYLPRTQNFGVPPSKTRATLDKATCERMWHAYHHEGASVRALAEGAGVSTNVVRQVMTGKSRRELTVGLKARHAAEAAQVKEGGCAVCGGAMPPMARSDRKTCSTPCLARMRRRPVSSHEDEPMPQAMA